MVQLENATGFWVPGWITGLWITAIGAPQTSQRHPRPRRALARAMARVGWFLNGSPCNLDESRKGGRFWEGRPTLGCQFKRHRFQQPCCIVREFS